MENVFRMPGRWLRGGLHMHTTASDGDCPPPEAVEMYRKAGYDFLAVTDHRVTTDASAFISENFLTIPSIELNGTDPDTGALYHIVGLGVTPFAQEEKSPLITGQAMVNQVLAAGGVPILAHPYWSGNNLDDIEPLQGVNIMEVYNATCANHGKERGEMHWDALLERGRRYWAVAVDDVHRYERDVAKGWVMVKAAALERSAILAALQAGHFYATRGPAILDIEYGEKEIRVHCSPVQQIRIIGKRGVGRTVWAEKGEEITFASVKRFRSPYVRVECTDAMGRTAWAPPVFL